MWDAAIAWLVVRGQTGQWGEQPASARPGCRELVAGWLEGNELTVAELDGRIVGVSVLARSHPAYVPAIERPESYLVFLLTSREHIGRGIGSLLVCDAAARARAADSEVLRVDCWAGAPGLVGWYERQGFEPSDTFAVGDWRGQVFEMRL
jgi:GNAT superfamily N-acetyltransferase